MRVLWWSALALLLCLAVTSALRTQNDTARVSRRFQKSNRSSVNENKTEDVATTIRSQFSRRREESTIRNKPSEHVSRTRSRSKPTEASSTNLSELPTELNEQFDSRKSNNRIRSRRPVIDEANFDTTLNREKGKSRSRQSSRFTTAQSAQPTQTSEQIIPYTEPSVKTTIKVSNYDDASKKSKDVTNNQFRRRSSTLRTVDITTPSRIRGRINTRTDTRPLDLEVSGTANALISTPKDPAESDEIRNSRKLKYRTRQSETDTNLTGEIVTSNERERKSSQSISKNILPSSTENIVERNRKENTTRATKVVKRPVSRRKTKNTIKIDKPKLSDEVTEDDNYPESFKALIQAKNASTHTSSPSSESLSVKASQKVFQTLTTTPKSFLETPEVEKPTSLRRKLNAEDSTENDIVLTLEPITTTPEQSKSPEYRLRGTYTPRNKIINTSSPLIISSTLSPSSQRPYKFSRKAKAVTTEGPSAENGRKIKRFETNINYKKPVIRSSFYPKRNFTKKLNIISEVSKPSITERSNVVRTVNSYKSRPILPRTSYYSRLRTNVEDIVTTTEAGGKDKNELLFADKKIENTANLPLIYTSNADNVNLMNHQQRINSKESSENGNDNELIRGVEEDSDRAQTTTQKYHATYKENEAAYEKKEKGATTLQPPIRNILTRKFNRKPIKQKEEYSTVTPKNRDRNLRKFSDTFSKTTEASSNGILAENDKPKNKFSSKYRESYLDKPFYKPTVPTITTSTVKGEDIQLGIDLNEISFTKTRSPLTSADLKLSESLAKPLQVMNVEASHHSPSVTVSIFDALAEILTSTPRPRISSTTEVTNKQNIISDVKQTFDAVSSNNNVNSVRDLSTQDTIMSKDNINTIVQSVQITEPTTPNVSNRMPLGGIVTQPLNVEDKKTVLVTTPKIFPSTVPSPPSTTPLSARKPFAIKVLYAETESPRDKMTSVSTLTKETTDNPKMVHNTVSDLVLFNNKIVSSELTSMLSNNIKNIIQNMDDGSKGRLSVEMAKLLKSLIPKLSDKSMTSNNDIDTFPNTTPYSLEDIKDTENIAIDGDEVLNISSPNLLQNVDNTIVNSTIGNISVNISSSLEEFGSTAPTLGGQTTLSNNELRTSTETSTSSFSVTEPFTGAPSVDVFINNGNNLNLNEKDITNNNTPVPFLTNFELNDFMSIGNANLKSNQNPMSNIPELILNSTSKPTSSLQISELEEIDNIEDPSQLSRLQLWILSKKARVLKMIEDLIRNHNDEIANAPLAELINNSKENNLAFSNRLNEIVNTMTTTISNSDITNENELTTTITTNLPETTTPTIPTPLSTQSTNFETIDLSVTDTSMTDLSATTTMFNFPTISVDGTDQSTTPTSTDTNTLSANNEELTTLKDQEIDTTTGNIVDMTTSLKLDDSTLDEIRITESITTENSLDTSTLGSTEISTVLQNNDVSRISNRVNVATTPSIPKKDYVIFGILPNNTVTKQIRTEKPSDGNGNAVFKFIPIDQVTVSNQESNVLKLASTKTPNSLNSDIQMSTINYVTESSTQTQIQTNMANDILTSTVQTTTELLSAINSEITTIKPEITETMSTSMVPQTTMTIPVQTQITTEMATTATSVFLNTNPTTITVEPITLSNIVPMSTTEISTSTQSNTIPSTVAAATLTTNNLETASSNQNEAELLQSLLREIGRSPKNINGFGNLNQQTQILSQINNANINKLQTTTTRSIEDDIRQFEEDTKLLKALLQATGRNPSELNLPSLDNIRQIVGGATDTIASTTDGITTTMLPTTTTMPTTTTRATTTMRPTTTITSTTNTIQTTTNSINEEIRKLQENTQLLQALLKATQNNNVKLPAISGITSNVRVASNPFTTSVESNPVTNNARPVYTTKPLPMFTTVMPGRITVSTFQPQQQNVEEFGISTTFRPFNERSTTTTRSIADTSTTLRSAKSSQFMLTTEIPSTSTFSDEEDLMFLQNLKSVLSTKTGDVDPETALANRVIALAVEKSLNEIQTGKTTTTSRPTTTTRTTTTMRKRTTTPPPNTPSIEDDIKQFEQDTKLLQALLKATGQDPSKLNIPTLPPTNRPVAGIDSSKSSNPSTTKPYGAKIAVKDELKNEQDDAQLLQTLIKLQDAQETTTQRSKIALTGQSSDEALKKLLQQAQPTGMLSEATKSSVSLSTEFGNSNDALLAALLKEQGFGPTTASSLDEQLRLAALLNQVVVTPKTRRTTTPPPPPSPRRPILDGLAWLWQQWRETGPGPGGAPRPNRRPAPSEKPASSAETSSRVNWFGSGPFVGNADEKPSSNRIPLEPPSVVTTDQGPGRGQLVSAAINVTRAFSQFLGAAIQGAAQTVQSVFRYGQRAATDTYTNGSG